MFRIGVDIDGVMYKWIKTAHYMLRDVMPNSPYTKDGVLKGDESQVNHFDYTKDTIGPDHWAWLWTEGVKLGLFRYGHLYPGTIIAMRELATMGDLQLITARPKQAVNDTLSWLAYLDLPVAGIHILTNDEPKSSVKPGCDVYIDDRGENVVDLAKNTDAEAVIIPDRPWNQTIPVIDGFHADIHRTVGWNEAVAVVRKVANGH